MSSRTSGPEPGERRLNGPQSTGREYHDCSRPEFSIRSTENWEIPVRDGVSLLADLHRPDADDRFPALISFSPYPRQLQDVEAPVFFVESGRTDFFVPRGYAHVVVNARGTSGSGGTWGMYDQQERDDLYDTVEWVASQPWCDGNVGMLGVSYFAMAQVAAATAKPPHLKAIAPFLASDDLYEICYHNGLYSAGFITAWVAGVGALAAKPDSMWRSHGVDLLRDVLNIAVVHARMHMSSEGQFGVIKQLLRAQYAEHPYGDLWRAVAVEHPTRDEFWDERTVRPLLADVDIPVYLAADWSNVAVHLPSTIAAWKELQDKPNVRLSLLQPGGFDWPWESMHDEVLAWFDQWLKGRETGIMDGPPIRYQLVGTDGWRTSQTWPPAEAALTPFPLGPDGTLGGEDDAEGYREYLYLPKDSGEPTNANPPELPATLSWETPVLDAPMELAGDIELALDARITATDTGWIAVLYDVPPAGEAQWITAGWLRATLATVDESASVPGAPVYDSRQPVAIPVGARRTYRIPVVATATHLPAGHRLRLVIASSDEEDDYPTVQNITHVVVREASKNTVFGSSTLWLPVVPAAAAGDA
jgi:predicted acyl esterase